MDVGVIPTCSRGALVACFRRHEFFDVYSNSLYSLILVVGNVTTKWKLYMVEKISWAKPHLKVVRADPLPAKAFGTT